MRADRGGIRGRSCRASKSPVGTLAVAHVTWGDFGEF